MEQVFIRANGGHIILSFIDEGAKLTAIAREDVQFVLLFLEMRRVAEDLLKLAG